MSELSMRSSALIAILTTGCSAALHVALIVLGVRGLPALLVPKVSLGAPVAAVSEGADSTSNTIDIELPHVDLAASDLPGALPTPGVVVVSPTGGQGVPRPDSGRDGRGGTNEATRPAINLADRDDGLRLARDLTSHLDRDQVSRIRSARKRASWDDVRLTTNPMELTFVASGAGREMERREPADTSPSQGLASAGSPTVVGGARIGAEPVPEGIGMRPIPVGAERLGAERADPGRGMVDREAGNDHRATAASEFARPLVMQGDPSVPSNESGPPKDTVDSRQEIAVTVQSLVDASTGGGRPGQGPGGSNGPGPTGAGGISGPGSRSQPLGFGPGAFGTSAVDPRVTAYRRRALARLWPLWENAFPRWAIAELRQGRVLVSIVILADGSVRDVRVTRPSGIDEFDRNCVAAVHKAAPFEPLPRDFGMKTMRWEISFDASNPVVR